MNDIMESYLQKRKRQQRTGLIISVLMLIGSLSLLAGIAFLQATQEAAIARVAAKSAAKPTSYFIHSQN